MASIIEGYNYDIFISYRQKDNKHDGWVTEFVNNLKDELESTFKEEISVYFDINPHDGLLETHDVDESLKDKLKCLIFIPIISRTYCDPKSFAWEHEFKAFVEMASKDKFGLKVKLANGNVASRVMPVLIHNPESDDLRLCESVLGSVLRGIEFIYEESGVNRPLKTDDDEKVNLKKTRYRNQINRTANSIRGIITGIKSGSSGFQKDLQKAGKKGVPANKSIYIKSAYTLLSFILLFAAGSFVYSHLIQPQPTEITIAVLPFRNPGIDSILRSADGLMQDVINNLQKVEHLTVRGSPSSYQYIDTKKPTATICRELKVDYIVGGIIDFSGKDLIVNVYLLTKKDRQIWSNEYPAAFPNLFSLDSKIAMQIASELKVKLTRDEIKNIESRRNINSEAMQYYQYGNRLYWLAGTSGRNEDAIISYRNAVRIDSSFALAYTGIANCYLDQYFFFHNRHDSLLSIAAKAIEKAARLEPDLPEIHISQGWYRYVQKDYDGAIKEYEAAIRKQPENCEAFYDIAAAYRRKGLWDKAEAFFLKAAEIDPARFEPVLELAETYNPLRKYDKAEEYYLMAINLRPSMADPYIWFSRMILSWTGDTNRASEILEDAVKANPFLSSDPLFVETAVQIEMIKRNYAGALNLLDGYKDVSFNCHAYFRPKTLYYAKINLLMNNRKLAEIYFDSVRIDIEKRIKDSEKNSNYEENARLYIVMGIALAGLGLNDDAIRYGEEAVRLFPVSSDAVRGPFIEEDLARIYVLTGEYDKALETLSHLLSTPTNLSVKNLETDPDWLPLSGTSKFQKILQEYQIE